jgi:hypothetical protein
VNSRASPCRRHSICRLEISTVNRRRTFRKRVRTRDMVLTRGGFRRYYQPDGRSVYVDDGMRDQRRCHGRPGWIDWNKTGPRGWTRDRKRINHEEAYSRTTLAPIGERSFSRARAARRLASSPHCRYVPLRYAQERSWRGGNRRLPNGQQVNRLAALSLKRSKSVDFGGYWQRHSKDVHA